MIFEDSYINELAVEAEQEISSKCQCIFNRFSLSVTAGTAEYQLPNNITGILQITYLGNQVYPLDLEDFGFSNWIRPQNLSAIGRPRFYLRRGFGFDKIKFHPIPSATIAADDSVINTIDGIKNRVIISCYKVSDPTSSDNSLRIPKYLRRNVMKYYILQRAYERESKAQNLQAAKFFGKQYVNFLNIFKKTIEKIPKVIPFVLAPSDDYLRRKLPKPVLPTSGKWQL